MLVVTNMLECQAASPHSSEMCKLARHAAWCATKHGMRIHVMTCDDCRAEFLFRAISTDTCPLWFRERLRISLNISIVQGPVSFDFAVWTPDQLVKYFMVGEARSPHPMIESYDSVLKTLSVCFNLTVYILYNILYFTVSLADLQSYCLLRFNISVSTSMLWELKKSIR